MLATIIKNKHCSGISIKIIDSFVEMKKIIYLNDQIFERLTNADKLYDNTVIFVVKKYHNEIKINDNESKKLAWLDINDLPKNMTLYTKKYLNKFGDILEEALREFEN